MSTPFSPGTTTVATIGAGHIGTAVARIATAAGYDVVVSNSRGPETLADLVAELGDRASADTAQGAAERGDLVVVTIPLHAIDQVPVEPLAGKVVVDTNNYYPQRDGQIAELDDQSATSTELLQRHLPDSKVVKAFNHIQSDQLAFDGTPSGTAQRRALAIYGDDADARAQVAAWLDELGYDVVDGGAAAESWRIQPDTPGYGPRLDAEGLRAALDSATR
ncbi:NADPH-dependent F420 reductase [Nocardioides flavescens]|uniref:NADP oxidoreductase n=1 Tax=Nocardioides flavescens TaxID=2691959 RepID=A0A6L7F342_9ACTN|nr:NAD(P)-binding domain-containing protein [Nocardioides flavescens]MXG90974.1 NADP oxidoreductase [Nocardioides flavescens]